MESMFKNHSLVHNLSTYNQHIDYPEVPSTMARFWRFRQQLFRRKLGRANPGWSKEWH